MSSSRVVHGGLKLTSISLLLFICLLAITPYTTATPHNSLTQTPQLKQEIGPIKTIVVSTGEWPPLISAKKQGHGPISMVISEAFAISGVKVEFRYFPWKRALQEVRTGRMMASSVWRKTDNRQQDFLFSEGVYDNQNVFFHLKSTEFNWDNLLDLKDYYIGAALGYAYSEDFAKAEQRGELEVFRVNKERSLVEMLLTKRIDVFPANREVGLELIRTQTPEAFDQYVIHPKPISFKPLHLVFHKSQQGEALLKQFNTGLKALKQSGRYAEIYNLTPEE